MTIAAATTIIETPFPAFAQSELELFSAEGIVTEIDTSELHIPNPADNQTYFELRDWDAESGKVLFTSGEFIGIMNPNATDVQTVSLPSEFHDPSTLSSPVAKAVFTGNGTILALVRNSFLVYEAGEDAGLVNTERYSLDEHVFSFEILNNANNMSRNDFNLVLVESHSRQAGRDDFEYWNELWLADSKGNKISKLYEGKLASSIAASHDGKRIAIPVVGEIGRPSYVGLIRLLVLDISRNQTSIVYEEYASSPGGLKWSPNDELLMYIQGAGVRVPIAALNVVSVDGAYKQSIYWGLDAPASYVVSEDGREVLIGISPYLATGIATKLYRLELARPVPEFGSIAVLVIAAGIVGAIVAARNLQHYGQKS